MNKPLTKKQQNQIIKLSKEGITKNKACEKVNCSKEKLNEFLKQSGVRWKRNSSVKPLTEKQKRQIVNYAKDEETTIREAAALIGCTPPQISYFLRKNQMVWNKPKAKGFTKEEKNKIKRLAETGISITEAAAQLKCRRQNLYNYIVDNQIDWKGMQTRSRKAKPLTKTQKQKIKEYAKSGKRKCEVIDLVGCTRDQLYSFTYLNNIKWYN